MITCLTQAWSWEEQQKKWAVSVMQNWDSREAYAYKEYDVKERKER